MSSEVPPSKRRKLDAAIEKFEKIRLSLSAWRSIFFASLEDVQQAFANPEVLRLQDTTAAAAIAEVIATDDFWVQWLHVCFPRVDVTKLSVLPRTFARMLLRVARRSMLAQVVPKTRSTVTVPFAPADSDKVLYTCSELFQSQFSASFPYFAPVYLVVNGVEPYFVLALRLFDESSRIVEPVQPNLQVYDRFRIDGFSAATLYLSTEFLRERTPVFASAEHDYANNRASPQLPFNIFRRGFDAGTATTEPTWSANDPFVQIQRVSATVEVVARMNLLDLTTEQALHLYRGVRQAQQLPGHGIVLYRVLSTTVFPVIAPPYKTPVLRVAERGGPAFANLWLVEVRALTALQTGDVVALLDGVICPNPQQYRVRDATDEYIRALPLFDTNLQSVVSAIKEAVTRKQFTGRTIMLMPPREQVSAAAYVKRGRVGMLIRQTNNADEANCVQTYVPTQGRVEDSVVNLTRRPGAPTQSIQDGYVVQATRPIKPNEELVMFTLGPYIRAPLRPQGRVEPRVVPSPRRLFDLDENEGDVRPGDLRVFS